MAVGIATGIYTNTLDVLAEEIDYASIYDEAVSQLKERIESMGWMDLSSMSYIFYDLNGDGYLEFLLEEPVGMNKAYTIYTTDGENCINLGDTGYLQNVYEPVYTGIVTNFLDNQNTQTVTQFTIENGALVKTTLYTGTYNEEILDGIVGEEIFASHKVTDGIMWDDEAENNDYVFPNSDTQYLSEEEVRAKNTEDLALGRNEIYARHGYIFQDPAFREYFENKPWYVGTMTGDQFDPSVFNEYENANLDLILRVEEEMTNGTAEPSVDYTGSYIDGTGNDYNHVVMTQNGNMVSYEWYTGDVYQCSEEGLQINEDGSVSGVYWNFWLEGEKTLRAQMSEGDVWSTMTLWKVHGEKTHATYNTFVGMEGTYIGTRDSESSWTGRVEISEIGEASLKISLGTVEGMHDIMTEYARIIDSNTAQITNSGITFTFCWNDTENMSISRNGEITGGTDAGPLGEITDNQTYTKSAEFN